MNAIAETAITRGTMPDHLIHVPDVRQEDGYSCGAMATASVCGYYGVGPGWQNGKDRLDDDDKEEYKRLLGTTEERSTPPPAIVDFLEGLGLDVEARSGMTLDDLTACWYEGKPVIVCVQEYGVPSKQASFKYGHYLVVIGRALHYVFVQDPSADNVIGRPGGSQTASFEEINSEYSDVLEDPDSLQAPGRNMIREELFQHVWHDEDADGNRYVRYGIVVGGGRRFAKSYYPSDGSYNRALRGRDRAPAANSANGPYVTPTRKLPTTPPPLMRITPRNNLPRGELGRKA